MNLIYMSVATLSMFAMNIVLKLSDFLGLIIKVINFAEAAFVGMFFYTGGLTKVLEFLVRAFKGIV